LILYEGPSQIDEGPIVGLITGIDRVSANKKTGPMAQLWILRSDKHPVDALRDGTDASVCGECPLRGEFGKKRGCYVNLHKGLGATWKKYLNGGYPKYTFRQAIPHLAGRRIRLGAYGDPAALPSGLLRQLVKVAARHTGYTHQWREFPRLKDILMASVESLKEMEEAQAKGWRTYRIVPEFTDITAEEIECPNVTKGTLCFECSLCSGNKTAAKSIAIEVHGGDSHEGFVFNNQTEMVWER
jgi:hypothetical protein